MVYFKPTLRKMLPDILNRLDAYFINVLENYLSRKLEIKRPDLRAFFNSKKIKASHAHSVVNLKSESPA